MEEQEEHIYIAATAMMITEHGSRPMTLHKTL